MNRWYGFVSSLEGYPKMLSHSAKVADKLWDVIGSPISRHALYTELQTSTNWWSKSPERAVLSTRFSWDDGSPIYLLVIENSHCRLSMYRSFTYYFDRHVPLQTVRFSLILIHSHYPILFIFRVYPDMLMLGVIPSTSPYSVCFFQLYPKYSHDYNLIC